MEKKRVLIGEDSSVIQNLTRSILSNQNYEVISAKNGQQVMEVLQSQPIDVILLDLAMPVMDGVQCARAIRTSPEQAIAKLPLIAITGNARNYSPAEFDMMGFDEVLTKPLNYDLLVELVNKYTKRQ